MSTLAWSVPLALGGALVLWTCVGLATGRLGVENAKYTALRRPGLPSGLELRRYEAHLQASIAVREAEARAASSRGFRFLAGYIFGGNAAQESIAMTAPVVLSRPPPASASDAGGAQHTTMAFVLPSRLPSLAALPQPNDPRVQLTQHGAALHAVRRLSPLTLAARFDEARIARELAALEADAAAAGLQWDAATVQRSVLAYDPPWTPWFVARTEVSLHPVRER
jgi:hypothetical protein